MQRVGRRAMAFLFEDLDVYQRAVEFAERVVRVCRGFPKGNSDLASQFRRAAISISCNIAEGNGRWHPRERFNFFMIARGSASECVPLLDLSKRLGLIGRADLERFREEIDAICKMLTRLARGAESKRRGSRGEQ
jgi:four helix bundle protein